MSTRTGWPAEAIKSGQNGILVDVGDDLVLANGVEWILSLHNNDWTNLSLRTFETASSGSWDESVHLFENALKHACHRSAIGEIGGVQRHQHQLK